MKQWYIYNNNSPVFPKLSSHLILSQVIAICTVLHCISFIWIQDI